MTARWIKICGLSSAADVAAAAAAGADAIGFVFAPSVREVTPALAAQLAEPVRGQMAIVAVMRHPAPAAAHAALAALQPDYLQTDAGDYAQLELPAATRALPVYRDSVPLPAALSGRFLYESDMSGSGRVADWTRARDFAAAGELVLAGGLGPANVAAAIEAVQPAGVDVSSGVESSPGQKDPALIRSFVAAARRA